MLVIIGPYCFGCKGNNVVGRYFWGSIAWTQKGPIEGCVKHAVCLDCSGDIGSKYPIAKRQESHDE